MYQNGRAGQRVDGFTRLIGLLAASSLLFSPTVRWFYIPVRFLLGLALLLWLVRPSQYWRTLRRFVDRVLTDRFKLLDQILDLNAAESAYKEFTKKLKKKLADGEVAFVEYNARRRG